MARKATLAACATILLATRPVGRGLADDDALAARLARRLAQAGLRATSVGVCVVSLDDGSTVFAKDADAPLIPASVAKVATAAAALDLLGPGWVFRTRLEACGETASGRLDGDLVVRGSGDPALSRRGHGEDWLHPWRALAEGAAQAGIRTVTGALLVDDAPFDRDYVHPTWSRRDLLSWVGAPVGGLSFNDNCITVRVTGASRPGAPALVDAPATSGPWALLNATQTVAGRRTEVGAVWVQGGEQVRVTGDVAAGLPYAFEVPVPDPLAFAGHALLTALGEAGVRVEGGIRVQRPGEVAPPGRLLASYGSALPATLRTMNRRSQNFYAASLFKACGARREGVGSWESGERAVADVLRRRGLGERGARIVDGSGLSRDNRLSALTVARLLATFEEDLLRGPFLRDSLAVPGEDGGTLEKRLLDAATRTRVRAKTGTLTGVYALAGYVDGKETSRGYAFAILLNAAPSRGDARDLIDDLVREIAKEG